MTIFDTTIAPADAQAVYLEGVASELPPDDVAPRIATYSQRSEARGLRPWTAADVTGTAPLRLYAARVEHRFVLVDGHRRVAV